MPLYICLSRSTSGVSVRDSRPFSESQRGEEGRKEEEGRWRSSRKRVEALLRWMRRSS